MKIFRLLSALLDYPSDGFLDALRELAAKDPYAFVESLDEEVALSAEEYRSVADFITMLLASDPLELQGAYVQCFDLTAEHSLHLTHHIFGEEKTRGPALIDLGEFYRSYGLQADEKELPDYLPVMLEFCSTLSIGEAGSSSATSRRCSKCSPTTWKSPPARTRRWSGSWKNRAA